MLPNRTFVFSPFSHKAMPPQDGSRVPPTRRAKGSATGLRVAVALLCLAAGAAIAAEPHLDALTLPQAEVLMLEHNRDIQAARRNVQGLRADEVSAAQRPNPTLSIGTTSIAVDHGTPGRAWDKQMDSVFRIDQTIERGGKRELRIKAARTATEAGTADAAETERQTRTTVAAAYYDLMLAQERESIDIAAAQLYGGSVHATELRLKAGDVSPTDLARLQVEAYRADNEARQARADKEKARLALAYLLGEESQAQAIHAVGPWPDPQPEMAADIDQLVARRPDVKAARMRVELADARRAQARALLHRDISVGVQYEHYPPDARNTVGVGVSFPLFANYQYRGEIQRAESDYGAALDDLERVRAQAFTEIGQTRADLDAASERLERYRGELMAKAEKNAAAAEFAYTHGAMPILDLLDARRTLKAIQLETAGARADYAKAVTAWQAALATGQDQENQP